jgi:hypothetical protein
MNDADTSCSLRWQLDVDGDSTKINVFKLEAASVPGLQFFAYMLPGDTFLVVGHSMSIIYATSTDIATFHGKMALFTGDRTGHRECMPVFLPPSSAFEWKTCKAVADKTALFDWYNDNPSEYGKLWEPAADLTREDIKVPRMIALPLRAAKLYHEFKGPAMPHELLQVLETHLASKDTTLDNGDDWGLVQKWLLVAAQKSVGTATVPGKSFLGFSTHALISNETLSHR